MTKIIYTIVMITVISLFPTEITHGNTDNSCNHNPTNNQPYCAADAMLSHLQQSNPGYLNQMEQLNDQIATYMKNNPNSKNPNYTLPLVVHIIHDNGPENLTDATVIQGVDHLNQAFENVGYYDPNTGVNTQIAFCLAKQDPNGNATTGITRTVSPLTNMVLETQDLAVKNLSRWDPLSYINIWLVRDICSNSVGCGVAGYAVFPASHGTPTDGIVNEAQFFGSSPGNSTIHTHEMGHYLGLYHTFQGGCANNDCTANGDRVCDTPPDGSTAPVPCNGTPNSCTTDEDDTSNNNPFRSTTLGGQGEQNDQFINYMDYGDRFCYSMFSQGQADRMNYFVQNVRNSLLNSLACNDPCQNPINAGFTASTLLANVGQLVNFTNTTVGGTTYEWQVDGSPISTNTNSFHTFNTAGVYTVTLVATNADPNCRGIFEVEITVVCGAQSGFTHSITGLDGTFTSNASGATTYQWTADGPGGLVVMGTTANTIYTFPQVGWYEICLIASNAVCSDTTCNLIYVPPQAGPTDEMVSYFGDAQHNYFQDVAYDAAADFMYVSGRVSNGTTLTTTLMKVSTCGQVQWHNTYHSGSTASLSHVLVMQDGNLIVHGHNGTNSVVKSIYKINTVDGSIIWSRTYTMPDRALGANLHASINDPAGETYYIGGWIRTGGSSDDFYVIKIDNAGNVIWQRQYEFSGDDQMNMMATVGGGFAIFGSVSGYQWVPTIGTFDANGTFITGRSYPGFPIGAAGIVTEFNAGVQTLDGGFLMSGTMSQSGYKPFVAKLNSDLSLAWAQGQPNVVGRNTRVLRDNYDNYYVSSYATIAGQVVYKVFKYDENYNFKWSKYLQTETNRAAQSGTYQFRTSNTIPDQLMVIDQSDAQTGNLGLTDAMLAITDTSLSSCITFPYTTPFTPIQSTANPISATPKTLSNVPGTYNTRNSITYTRVDLCGYPPCGGGGCTDADAAISISRLECAEDSIVVNYSVCNIGGTALPISTPVTFYDGDPTLSAAATDIYTHVTSQAIAPDSCYAESITIPAVYNSPVHVIVNDDASIPPIFDLATDFPSTNTVECDYVNNMTDFTFDYVQIPLDLGPDINVCENGIFELNAGAGYTSYQWFDGSMDSTYTAYTSGTYWVNVIDECGFLQSDSVIITLDTLDIINQPDYQICLDDSVMISIPGYDSYDWFPKDGTINCDTCSTVTITPMNTNTYTVVVGSSLGCFAVDSFDITISDIICSITVIQDVTVYGGSDGSASASASNGIPAYTYDWSDGQTTPIATGLTAGNYTVTIYDDIGCAEVCDVMIIEPDPDCDPCSAAEINDIDICLEINGDPNHPWATLDCDNGGVINITECLNNGDPLEPSDDCSIAVVSNTDICSLINNNPDHPLANEDCDEGGIPNYLECQNNGDPADPADECTVALAGQLNICKYINYESGHPMATLDCDMGGVENFVECINGSNASDPSDDCTAAVRGGLDICAIINNDPNHPWASLDCDEGSVINITECANGTNPSKPSDDIVCLPNLCAEAIVGAIDICDELNTDPNHPIGTLDCDGDGVTNADECIDGTDPLDPCDFVDTSITLPVTADQSDCPFPCQDLSPTMTILPGNIAGQSAVEVAVKVSEVGSVDTDGTVITVRIPSDPRLVFVWDIGLTLAALVPVQNADWNYLGDNGIVHSWTFNGAGLIIPAGGNSAFGFQSFYDPQSTDGQTTLTATIFPFSGGECKITNNTDSERLVYFE